MSSSGRLPNFQALNFEILHPQQTSYAYQLVGNLASLSIYTLHMNFTLAQNLHSLYMGFQALSRARAHQPCAACRMLRRRCGSNCTLAPYFPGDEIEKFAGVHKVFGASNVIKMIQMVEETKREDTVKAIVYEATARLKDPVYGSTGAIFHLQKMVQELKGQLESTRARVLEMQEQRDQLLGSLMNVHQTDQVVSPINQPMFDDGNFSLDGEYMAYDPVKFPTDCNWIL